MRIKNRYSIEDKVEIVVDSDYKFQEIACLVDSHKFIIEARILRKRLNINEPIVDLNKRFVDLFTHWEKVYEEWAENNNDKVKVLDLWVKRMLRNFELDRRFRDVLMQAILFNMVVSYRGLIQILNKHSKFTHPTVAIIPTPHTTYNEVEQALHEAKKLMGILKMEYKTSDLKDTIPNIRQQYRDWFWKVALGKSYKEVAREWNNVNKTNLTYTDIGKALNKYKKLLQ